MSDDEYLVRDALVANDGEALAAFNRILARIAEADLERGNWKSEAEIARAELVRLRAQVAELEADLKNAEEHFAAELRRMEKAYMDESPDADLLAALEEARVVLSGAAFGSWAQENRRPELRVAYDHIDAAIAAHQGEEG